MRYGVLAVIASLLIDAGRLVGQSAPLPNPAEILLTPRKAPSSALPDPSAYSNATSSDIALPAGDDKTLIGASLGHPASFGQGPWTGPGVARDGAAPEIHDGLLWQREPPLVNHRVWADAEFLYWWDKKQSLPPNLVTTGSPSDSRPGALGQPNTQVLFGPSDVGYSGFAGFRGSAGLWLDPNQVIGLEAGGFLLENRANITGFNSTAGSPLLALRRLDQPGDREDAFVITSPGARGSTVGPFSGGLVVRTDSQLWGSEGNLVHPLFWSRDFHLEAIAGLRYLDLNEHVDILTQKVGSAAAPVTFLGTRFAAPDFDQTSDTFHGSNHFLGGQLGLRGDWIFDRFFLRFGGTLALGQTDEVLDVMGLSKVVLRNTALQTAAGGLYALPSNSGRFHNNDFSIIPELQFKAGMLLTPCLRAMVGYDFLYWTRVLRPGDQIDLNVDPRQVPSDPSFKAGIPGTFPQPLVNHSDFWAQGITVSLEFTY
jgi:Putative beta barrel porin-7 (BBP7)